MKNFLRTSLIIVLALALAAGMFQSVFVHSGASAAPACTAVGWNSSYCPPNSGDPEKDYPLPGIIIRPMVGWNS